MPTTFAGWKLSSFTGATVTYSACQVFPICICCYGGCKNRDTTSLDCRPVKTPAIIDPDGTVVKEAERFTACKYKCRDK